VNESIFISIPKQQIYKRLAHLVSIDKKNKKRIELVYVGQT